MFVSSLHTYPVKSGRVIDLTTSDVDLLGLSYDRRWVIIEDGRFISQRSHPQLARLCVTPTDDTLTLSYCDANYSLDLKAPIKMKPISVWADNFPAAIYDDPVNDWLSEHLGGSFELASMSGQTRRRRPEHPQTFRGPAQGF